MSSEHSIILNELTKRYEIYERPGDRLKQMFLPRLRRIAGLPEAKYFSEFWALKSLSLSIPKGQTVGIIGRNGSGKSTLLQLICGTLQPTTGTISTSGRIGALLELGAGFNPEFTGRENVKLNATILGLSERDLQTRFEDILRFADIGDFIDQPVKTYSSGMYVRLAFAVIAHIDADLLIIDEALAVGDAFFTQKCMRFLSDFVKRGSVVFVSHDTAAVRALCTRAIWLDKGQVVMDGSPKDVCNKYLKAYYSEVAGDPPADDESATDSNQKLANRPEPTRQRYDGRLKFLNNSNLRNDLKIFRFEPSDDFGLKGAEITDVRFQDGEGRDLAWVVGGEDVRIEVKVTASVNLASPIIGFMVKDRLGQTLFGDNTFLTTQLDPVSVKAGEIIIATFSFSMPILPVGDYVVSAAVANGTQENHVQHHWIHDALHIKSEASSVATGLVGVAMYETKIVTAAQNAKI